ncbi:MAG: type IV toxin-antitoxin system AbiEi family antitoxin domain-containing protein [Desulfobacteria bacterium]
MRDSKTANILKVIKEVGIVRPVDLTKHGVRREQMYRLHKRGLVERIGRGLYALPQANITENHGVAEACKKIPRGVICLLSALRLHGLTTQSPFEVWMAIDRKARLPRPESPKCRFVRYSGDALTAGVEVRRIEKVPVRVYGVAKTVVDCFKYRNKIGLDVALEALRESRRERACTMDELLRYAKICRVANVMRPYLESVA